MANTKLPARLLDTSAVPALNVTGDLTVDTTTLKVDSSNNRVKIGDTAVASATNAPLHVAKSSTDVQAIFGDNNTSIDDPSIRIIGRDTGNSAIRYMFAGLDADANHGFIGYNHGSGSFTNALNFDTSGKVGIGTTSPAYELDVQSTSDPAQIRLKEDGNTNGFIFKNYDGNEAQLVNADNGPMVFKTNDLERMRIDASGNLKFNSGFGSVGTSYAVRAWVNFDGNYSSDAVIEEDGNVSSVVDNAVGDYTINFSSNMPDGHYAVSGFGVAYASNNVAAGCIVGLHTSGTGTYIPTTKTTSAVRVCFGFGNTAALSDIRDGSIIIVR
tara:strand:+ start:1712 stop:2692 length:981 start_codon:yes stop_codon:yes gene_type:complete